MAISEEEKQEIIDRAVEKALLLIPEVVGNQMQQQAALHKLNGDFYKKYPEFKEHKDCVVSVIEQIEGKNPLKTYDQIQVDAVPLIRQRIKTKQSLDMGKVNPNPNRNFNGAI